MLDQEYAAYRPYLFAIAYRMLGSPMDAEDIVQEAFMRYDEAAGVGIQNPKAYLASIVTRLSINMLKSARVRNETGQLWMPEPVMTGSGSVWDQPEEQVGRKETLSLAFLMLLERLSPEERAVFILRDVFDYDYSDIAAMLHKSEASCRQWMHRARAHMTAATARYEPTPHQQVAFTQAFAAASQGDLEPMLALLTEDVVSWGSGVTSKTPVFIQGRELQQRAMRGTLRLLPPNTEYQLHEINGEAGVLMLNEGMLFGVIILSLSTDGIHRMYYVTHPDKLRYLADQYQS